MNRLLVAVVAVALFGGGLMMMMTAGGASQGSQQALAGGVSALGIKEIPRDYLAAYLAAAARTPGVPWSVIAGIGKVECDHGLSPLEGCHSGANSAGAMGPMQFLAATWAGYRADCGGGGDVYDIRDAACGAAAMLKANGADRPAGLQAAIWAYNHAGWYVDLVLWWAGRYAGAALLPSPGGGAGKVSGTGTIQPLFPWVPLGGFPTCNGGLCFVPGQCTWWASYNHPVAWNGNAFMWWANAATVGATESALPAVGAIAVWKAGPAYGELGHLAIVTAFDGHTYTVSEMNFLGPFQIDTRVVQWPDPNLYGFIL